MREFFRGWKRKVGVVTLLMACVLTVGWMRSWTITDWYIIRGRDNALHSFVSSNNWVGWIMQHEVVHTFPGTKRIPPKTVRMFPPNITPFPTTQRTAWQSSEYQ